MKTTTRKQPAVLQVIRLLWHRDSESPVLLRLPDGQLAQCPTIKHAREYASAHYGARIKVTCVS